MTEKTSVQSIRVMVSIRWKLLAIMMIVLISLVTVLTSIQIRSQKIVLEEQLHAQNELKRQNLAERGKSIALTLKQQVENYFASSNISALEEAVKDSVHEHQELKYGILVNASGEVFLHTDQPELFGTTLSAERDRLALQQNDIAESGDFIEDGESVIEIVSPIQVGTIRWGVLRLIFTLEYLQQEFLRAEQQIQQEIRNMMQRSVVTSLVFMAVCSFLVFIFSTSVSTPLIHLAQSARKLAQRDFTVSEKIAQIRSRDEVGVLASTFVDMSQELKELYHDLDRRVKEQTEQLRKDVQYAKRIQKALLPDFENVHTFLPQSFFLWMPRESIGGDMIFTESFDAGFILAVIDCTGHGVPGAIMTMLASSALTRIIHDEGCHDPAEILQRLNRITKTLLKQDTPSSFLVERDDGMDAGICFVKPGEGMLIFAGAGIPLYSVQNSDIILVKGDKTHLIGYRRSGLDVNFTNHTIRLEPGMAFYLASDGFCDQRNEDNDGLGSDAFEQLLIYAYKQTFEEQQEIFADAFRKHKSTAKQTDDVVVVGFSLDNYHEIFRQAYQVDKFLFHFQGPISQQVVRNMVAALDQRLPLCRVSETTKHQLFTICVEIAHNIMRYSDEKQISPDADGMQQATGVGTIAVGRQDNRYIVISKNIVDMTAINMLKHKLQRLQNMPKDDLQAYYREHIRNRKKDGSRGGGLGFIEIVRHSSQSFEFTFEPIDDRRSVFIFRAVVV